MMALDLRNDGPKKIVWLEDETIQLPYAADGIRQATFLEVIFVVQLVFLCLLCELLIAVYFRAFMFRNLGNLVI